MIDKYRKFPYDYFSLHNRKVIQIEKAAERKDF